MIRRGIRILWLLLQNGSIVLMAGSAIWDSDLRKIISRNFLICLVAALFLLAAVLGSTWELQRKRLGRRVNVGIPVVLMAICGVRAIAAMGRARRSHCFSMFLPLLCWRLGRPVLT